MTLRGVLFDFTDTLAELEEDVGIVYARAAAEFGFELSAALVGDAFREVVRELPGCHFPGAPLDRVPALERDWWRELARRTFAAARPDASFAAFDACFDALFDFYATPEAWRLRPGAAGLLRELRRADLASGVVSNFDHRLPDLLEGLGIAGLLDCVEIPSRCGARKPERAIFEAAARDLDLPLEQLVFLGHDPRTDLAGARAAGLRAWDARALPSLDALREALDEASPARS